MRVRVIVAVLAVGMLGCSGDDDDVVVGDTAVVVTTPVVATSTTVIVSGTTAAPSTAPPTEPTPTVAGDSTVPVETTAAPAPTAPPSDLEDLALYWGFISALTTGDTNTVTIDVVEVYFGDEAVAEGAKDSIEVPTDIEPVIYVRNTDPAPKVLEIIAEASVTLQGCDYGQGPVEGCSTATAGSINDLPVESGELVLFQLSSGRITRIDVPFFP